MCGDQLRFPRAGCVIGLLPNPAATLAEVVLICSISLACRATEAITDYGVRARRYTATLCGAQVYLDRVRA
jgi:hypothetical protein